MANSITLSKFTIGPDLAERILKHKRPDESLTSTLVRLLRDGMDAPVRSEVVRLRALAASSALAAGRLDLSRRHLHAILGAETMPEDPTPPRSAHETSNDPNCKANP